MKSTSPGLHVHVVYDTICYPLDGKGFLWATIVGMWFLCNPIVSHMDKSCKMRNSGCLIHSQGCASSREMEPFPSFMLQASANIWRWRVRRSKDGTFCVIKVFSFMCRWIHDIVISFAFSLNSKPILWISGFVRLRIFGRMDWDANEIVLVQIGLWQKGGNRCHMYPPMVKHFVRNVPSKYIMIMHGADLWVVNDFHSFKSAKRFLVCNWSKFLTSWI